MYLASRKTMVIAFFESEHSLISFFTFKFSKAKERPSTIKKVLGQSDVILGTRHKSSFLYLVQNTANLFFGFLGF